VGRLSAGANIWLHLVEPLGFELDDRYLKRAGLDYWPHVKLCVHPRFEAIEAIFPRERLHFLTKKTERIYTDVVFEPGAVLVFGRETRGLDEELLERYAERTLRIPTTDKVRSLNLSNACAVVVYEALRQLEWAPLDVG
ncbi:MAG: tRNA (cytidine(34)-2'-O)-methyltransferase, partial [Bradymonadaceae bacterium]